MLAADIKERLLKEPFDPFRIRSSSGKVYAITQPFLVALMKSKVFIASPNSDRWDELSYLHIAALESMTNGHGSKRRGRTK
ncbi:MAG: hypothetical protein ACKVW3_18345 [Phycisphaerales bacterium]